MYSTKTTILSSRPRRPRRPRLRVPRSEKVTRSRRASPLARAPSRPRRLPSERNSTTHPTRGLPPPCARLAVAATLPRYLTFFEYDGSALHGFQPTVRRHRAHGAGRAGRRVDSIHGLSWTGDVRRELEDGRACTRRCRRTSTSDARARTVERSRTTRRARRGLNYHLKQLGAAVRVTECVRVDELNPTFPRRHDAVSRLYEYKLSVGTETMVGVCSITNARVVRRRSGLLAGKGNRSRATAR